MNRPSKKDIKAAIEKLKEKPVNDSVEAQTETQKLPPKHSSQRIRKKGV